MSFIVGLIWGIAIAGLEVALEHYGPSFGPFALSGNGALAAPLVLVPLAIFLGWTSIADSWSGRSLIPTIAFTAGLYLGVGLAVPADAVLYPQGPASTLVNSIPGLFFTGAIFVLPAALLAAAIYFALKRERVPASAVLILILYLISVPFAVLLPIITMGIVAGTAAGHAWQRPGSRTTIGLIVIALMLVAVFGVPYLLSGGGLPR